MKYLQDNWKIVLPVIIGFVLLIWWLNRDIVEGGSTITVYIASIEEQKLGTNYLEIKMEQWDSIDGHWKKSKSNLSENEQINKISKYINYLSITGESKQIIPIDNKIYLCDKDATDRIIGGQISVEYKGQITPLRFKKPLPFKFDLNGIQADSKANCDEDCNLESKNIRCYTSKCSLKVSIKNTTPNRTLLVSVNGIDGDYLPKIEWDIKSIKKYDVWVKYANSTCSAVGSADNNGTPPINSCKECLEKEWSIEFSKFLNAWGKDPNNRDLQIPCNAFYKSFIEGNNKFIVNGKVFHNWSDIYNLITNENADDNKIFKLKFPVIISNNCSDVTIEFIYD